MKRSRPSRGGFVTFIAVTMVAVVVAAMLVLGQTFTIDAQRTQNRSIQAQLDQLLVAGTADAEVKLATNAIPLPEWNVDLPEFLKSDATLKIASIPSSDAAAAIFDIRATFATQTDSQRVTFTKINGSWKLTSAELSHDKH